MTEDNKNTFLELIKSIDLDEMIIPEEAKRKWFKFGGHEMARILSEKVKEIEIVQ